MKQFFDLTEPLLCDTLLAIKLTRYDGRPGFVHYIIPVMRKDGTQRLYGDLYHYFTQKPGFRFAIGYYLQEDGTGKYWEGDFQYLYFDKRQLPFESPKFVAPKIILPKYPGNIYHDYQPLESGWGVNEEVNVK